MTLTSSADARAASAQLFDDLHNDSNISSSRWNALKHGLHAEAVLLPGDDVAEFRRRRLALFHTYRPQTEDEAECVETMAECRWRLKRCRPVQATFDQPVCAPAADAAGRISEPAGHKRLHSSMDVTVHQQRIDRMLCRARAKLLDLQRLRRMGLIEGALVLPRDCYLDVTGEVLGPVPAQPAQSVAAPCQAAPAVAPATVPPDAGAPATPLGPAWVTPRFWHHEEIGNSAERTASPAAPGHVRSAQRHAPSPRGRLIGGFGARRLFAAAAHTPDAAHGSSSSPLQGPTGSLVGTVERG